MSSVINVDFSAYRLQREQRLSQHQEHVQSVIASFDYIIKRYEQGDISEQQMLDEGSALLASL
jgi:hypothetical protein